MGAVRKTIRGSLLKDGFEDVEDNIDMILDHLLKTGRMQRGQTTTSKSTVQILKIAKIGQNFESEQISSEEIAPFLLKENSLALENEISWKMAKVVDLNNQIRSISKNTDKTTALKLLRQRKAIEKFIDGLHDRKATLEQMLMSIEEGLNNKAIFDTMKVANEAS